jgi:CheY-like chemotaxis protein
MFFDCWPVLFVDDEPDVLTLSRLAVRNFEVYGLPLKVYTAASKAEAIRLLQENAELAGSLAVAFLDVVMESDHAGLDLCDYLRKEMGGATQVFVRTGQAGLAPERDVIDKYDIAGYFSKTEMTQNKLYSVIKSSVRQYLAFGMSQATIDLLHSLIVALGSRERILEAVHPVAGMSEAQTATPRWLIVGGEVLFGDEVDAARALEVKQRLSALPAAPLSPFGDTYVKDGEGYQRIHIAARPNATEADFIFKTRFAPPEQIVGMLHSFVSSFAVAWTQSAEN